MDGVGTSIIGRPRPLPEQRRANHPYTLNCEEPVSIPDGTMEQPYPAPLATPRGDFRLLSASAIRSPVGLPITLVTVERAVSR